jgi:acid stress-induced BolA-like protein IbaG/YrbA
MIAPSLKKKISDVLKSVYFDDAKDRIDVLDGEADDLYLRVVSPKFMGMRPRKKNDLIWDILMDRLRPEEWGEISMTVALAPNESDPLEPR